MGERGWAYPQQGNQRGTLGNGRCHRGVLDKAGKLSWGGRWVGLHISNQFLLDWVSIKHLCRIIIFLIVLRHIKFTSTEKNVIRVVCKSGLIGIGGRDRLEKTQEVGSGGGDRHSHLRGGVGRV